MKKILAMTKGDSPVLPEKHLLQCSICGENDRRKLLVEDIGMGVGMSGDFYCFCCDCWNAPDVGKKILEILGYPQGIKYIPEALEEKIIE